MLLKQGAIGKSRQKIVACEVLELVALIQMGERDCNVAGENLQQLNLLELEEVRLSRKEADNSQDAI